MVLLMLTLACGDEPQEEPTSLGGTYRKPSFLAWEGVEVCVEDLPEVACVTTDGDGDFLLEGLPLETDITVVPSHEELIGTNHPHNTADYDNPWNRALITRDKLDDAAADMGGTFEAGTGFYGFVVITDFPDWALTKGVTFSLEPDPGVEGYYGDAFGSPDPDLDATGAAGSGGMLNIPPGDYLVQFEGPGGPCRRIASWDFEEGDPVPVRIEADEVTYMEVICPPEG